MTAMAEEQEVKLPEWVYDTFAEATYSEARTWFQWLNIFVPSDVAESMGVSDAVAERFCLAGTYHGIIEKTDDFDGREYIYEYVPLPPAPRFHPEGPLPERVTPGVYELAPRSRGMPIRIRDERTLRRILSTSGARAKHVQREKRYQKMVTLQAKRIEGQKVKAAKEQQFARKAGKHKGKVVDW